MRLLRRTSPPPARRSQPGSAPGAAMTSSPASAGRRRVPGRPVAQEARQPADRTPRQVLRQDTGRRRSEHERCLPGTTKDAVAIHAVLQRLRGTSEGRHRVPPPRVAGNCVQDSPGNDPPASSQARPPPAAC